MVAIIGAPALRLNSRFGARLTQLMFAAGLAAIVGLLARHESWLPAAWLAVMAAETWPWMQLRDRWFVLDRIQPLVGGLSAATVVALVPHAVSQLIVVLLYAAWRWWYFGQASGTTGRLLSWLVVQAVSFEALFMAAAIWRVPRPIIMVLVWGVAYVVLYQVLRERSERAAGILATAWALVAAEATWVFMTWLVSYVPNKYVVVPQASLVLTALAYCFGNIYSAQRQGSLNRNRLTEYLLIGLILIALVIAGTPWRGTI